MLDILAATARKDYTDRKRRQAQGVQKAKELGKYKGRQENIELQRKIETLLKDGKSYSFIQSLVRCSRHTIEKVSKRISKGTNTLDDGWACIQNDPAGLTLKFTLKIYTVKRWLFLLYLY